MSNRDAKSLLLSALLTLGCGGNAVDVGHSTNRGWADAPAKAASATTPQTIYESEDAIFGFALDDDTLYALITHDNTFELVSCPLERCRSQRTVLFSGPKFGHEGFEPAPLVLAAGSLYWLITNGEPWSIATCPTTGCAQPQLLATRWHTGLAGDADGAYWIDADQSLMRMAPNAEAPERVRNLASDLVAPQLLSAHGEYLYYNYIEYSARLSSIRRVRKDGTSPSELVVTDDAISGLSVAADGLYYPSQLLAGRIVKCPVDDCAAGGTTIAANQRWPKGILVDGNEAFWLNNPRFSGQTPHAALLSCRLPECASVNERVADFPAVGGTYVVDATGLGPMFAVNRESIVWLEGFHGFGSRFRRVSR